MATDNRNDFIVTAFFYGSYTGTGIRLHMELIFPHSRVYEYKASCNRVQYYSGRVALILDAQEEMKSINFRGSELKQCSYGGSRQMYVEGKKAVISR